jgi:acyl-coenzyme A thioesterase PaaI-like protein
MLDAAKFGDTIMIEYEPVDPNYESRIRSSFEKQGVMKTIGARLVKIAPGEVVIEFSYDPSLTQQHGYIHAGVVTTVVDSACGYARTR